MAQLLMIYNLKANDVNRIKFNRAMFNYVISSHKGKYKTTSKGILKKFEKPTRSVIIFEEEFMPKIGEVLAKFNVDYKLYEINRQLK